jgi:hypothetical protein
MYRATALEVTLRRQEQLREAEARRRAESIRRTDRRRSRIARVLGLVAATVR